MIAKVYIFFEISMGNNFTEPLGTSHSIQECCLVDMFLKSTKTAMKDKSLLILVRMLF